MRLLRTHPLNLSHHGRPILQAAVRIFKLGSLLLQLVTDQAANPPSFSKDQKHLHARARSVGGAPCSRGGRRQSDPAVCGLPRRTHRFAATVGRAILCAGHRCRASCEREAVAGAVSATSTVYGTAEKGVSSRKWPWCRARAPWRPACPGELASRWRAGAVTSVARLARPGQATAALHPPSDPGAFCGECLVRRGGSVVARSPSTWTPAYTFFFSPATAHRLHASWDPPPPPATSAQASAALKRGRSCCGPLGQPGQGSSQGPGGAQARSAGPRPRTGRAVVPRHHGSTQAPTSKPGEAVVQHPVCEAGQPAC